MDIFINLLFFFGKILLLIVLVGVPFFLIIVFIADKVYKKLGPKYEEIKEKRIRELEEGGKKNKDKTKRKRV